jgi:hypothetical protein
MNMMIIVIIVLVVLVAMGVGGYFLYQAFKKGMTSGSEDYLVSTKVKLNLNELTTLESAANSWKDTFLFKITSNKEIVTGNDGTDDNLYVGKKVTVTVGEYGIPHYLTLTTAEQKVVLFKSGTKSVVMKIKLNDANPMSSVTYEVVLEGCPTGVSDFTVDELKRFPTIIYIRWYTKNKIAQGISWTIKPLFNSTDVNQKIANPIAADADGNNADQHLELDLNLLN